MEQKRGGRGTKILKRGKAESRTMVCKASKNLLLNVNYLFIITFIIKWPKHNLFET